MNLRELKEMGKTEFATYVATTKVKDLKQILKAEGVKGSKLRKAEVLEKLMELVGEDKNDEKDTQTLSTLVEKVELLKKDIEIRTAYEEDYAGLIVGMLKMEYIDLGEFKALVKHYDLDLLYADKLEAVLNYYGWANDYYSEIDRYKEGYLGTDTFDYSEIGKCYDPKDESTKDWTKSSFVKEGNITVAIMFDEYDQNLCFFEDKKLLANFGMVRCLNINNDHYYEDIQALEKYLNIKLMETYIRLQEKMEGYYMREEKRNIEKQKAYEEKKSAWEKEFKNYTTRKFEEIFDKNLNYTKLGKLIEEEVKNAKKNYQYNHKKYEYKKQDYGDLFGYKPTVKEEDKPLYKNIYKTLMLKFHPDKMGDEGTKYAQIINELKREWAI